MISSSPKPSKFFDNTLVRPNKPINFNTESPRNLKPKEIIRRVWGSVPAPENYMFLFLVSNIGYLIFGSILLLTDDTDPLTGAKLRNDSRYWRGWLMLLVGVISVVFHSNQIVHGHEDHRTDIFHILDVSFAMIVLFIAILLNGTRTIQWYVWLVSAVSIIMFLDSNHYGIVHSLWHLGSSFVLYELLNY